MPSFSRAAPVRKDPRQRPRAPRPPRRMSLARLTRGQHLSGKIGRSLRQSGMGRWLERRLCRNVHFHEVPIQLARGGPALDGTRIAFVSDLHAGTFMGEAAIEELFGVLAGLQPDLVAFGGDLVDSQATDVHELERGLRLLDPPLGMFAVPGNHDRAADRTLERFRSVLEASGVRVLVNEGERIKREADTLWLAGVDDLSLGVADLERALAGAHDDEASVLLAHQPDLFLESAYAGVDLTLSGHTHGGQIAFGGQAPWLRSHSQCGYYRGHHEDGGAQLYVGRGAGVTLLPLRVGAPAEIPIIELRTPVVHGDGAGAEDPVEDQDSDHR